jgi:hypothetical protein
MVVGGIGADDAVERKLQSVDLRFRIQAQEDRGKTCESRQSNEATSLEIARHQRCTEPINGIRRCGHEDQSASRKEN